MLCTSLKEYIVDNYKTALLLDFIFCSVINHYRKWLIINWWLLSNYCATCLMLPHHASCFFPPKILSGNILYSTLLWQQQCNNLKSLEKNIFSGTKFSLDMYPHFQENIYCVHKWRELQRTKVTRNLFCINFPKCRCSVLKYEHDCTWYFWITLCHLWIVWMLIDRKNTPSSFLNFSNRSF